MDISKHVFVGSIVRNNNEGHSLMTFHYSDTLKFVYQLVDVLDSGQEVYLIYEVDRLPTSGESDTLIKLVEKSPEIAVALKTSKSYFDSESYQVIKQITSEEAMEEWISMM